MTPDHPPAEPAEPVRCPIWRQPAEELPGKLSPVEVSQLWHSARAWCRARIRQRVLEEEARFGPLDTRCHRIDLVEVH